MLSLVEIRAFRLDLNLVKNFFEKINFPPIRTLEFATGHMIYKLAYTSILQTTTTNDYSPIKSTKQVK